MVDDRRTLLYSMLIRVRDGLRDRGDRIVLAESCTAGLVAAELGQIPGISDFFCGSMIVYRTATKTAWLGIPSEVLQDPAIGPVSAMVTLSLAEVILEKTPEATLAAAITGHLGPGAPTGMDGQVYCAIVRRGIKSEICEVQSLKLSSGPVANEEDFENRFARQKEAAYALLCLIDRRVRNIAD